MEINPTTTTGTTGTKAATENATTGAVTGDFQTFLTLLTTQMRNQDPLKPMDSTEFVAQLASFSAVEQQIRSNDRLQGILDVLSGGSTAGLAEWIGREVRVAAKASFAGAPVDVGVTSVEGADRAVLVVKNDFDSVVARVPVQPGASDVSWDGKDEMGNSVAHGVLRLHAGELRRQHASGHERRQGLQQGAGGPGRGRSAHAGRGRGHSGAGRRGRRGPLRRRPVSRQITISLRRALPRRLAQPGSSTSLAALSSAASASLPPRSGCTRRIRRL